MPALKPGAHIHIVGIGGSGMSALARVLLEQGKYRISGSDRNLSDAGRALAGLGAVVYDGHQADQVRGADVVLISSAIPPDNVEVEQARALGIAVVKRPQALAWITSELQTIAVAGTHGKTTTTAMIASLLVAAGLDPSYIVGGPVATLGANAHAGHGEYFVVEADEYDRTFHSLRPRVAVVTNVEMDHPDCYPTYADVRAAFSTFVEGTVAGGCLVACGDDPGAQELLRTRQQDLRAISYGLGGEAQVRAVELASDDTGQEFDLLVDDAPHGRFRLQVPGAHNVRNALAAIAVALELGIPDEITRKVLAGYRGVARRFELKGQADGVTVIDDYAHHPTKIRATLAAARSRFGNRTIWAVFQPHTFTRTRALLDEYRRSFTDADHVLITPIYAAREQDDGTVSSTDLVCDAPHPDIRLAEDLNAAVATLVREVRPGDVVLVMGAGDSYRVGEGVLSRLRERTR